MSSEFRVPVYVEVSSKYLWALRPFAYLFNTFWGKTQQVTAFGYRRPDFDLPPNFNFVSIAEEDYPPEKWSDGLIEFLERENTMSFVLMLVDYWLCRYVDAKGVSALGWYCQRDPSILRLDLTADRLNADMFATFASGSITLAEDVGYCEHFDIISADRSTQYQFSLQASIWNREAMLRVLKRGMTPWELELYTTIPRDLSVVGTRQFPVRYANAILKGKLDAKQVSTIPLPFRDAVIEMIPDYIEVSKRTITDMEEW